MRYWSVNHILTLRFWESCFNKVKNDLELVAYLLIVANGCFQAALKILQ